MGLHRMGWPAVLWRRASRHMPPFHVQVATCFCAPFGGAIQYKEAASNEYPPPVEASQVRAAAA